MMKSVIHSKSDDIEIMINNEADEVMKELFKKQYAKLLIKTSRNHMKNQKSVMLVKKNLK